MMTMSSTLKNQRCGELNLHQTFCVLRKSLCAGRLQCFCACQVESETSKSELKLSNTTGQLVQLEREVSLLRQNILEMNQQVEKTERITEQARQNAEAAQQVTDQPIASSDHHLQLVPDV